jgi:alpha-beta hydrolase superfamily lysophospholipase
MTEIRTSELKTADKTPLFVRQYLAHESSLAPHDDRTLVIVHGLSEHGGRYDHFARVFAECGWSVIVADLRGHGQSGGVPTHVTRFNRYLDDVQFLFDSFELPPQRTALLGHSTGSLISIRFLETREPPVQAAVLLAPLLALGVRVDRMTMAVGKLLSHVLPRTRFRSKVDPSATTRSLEAIQRREIDPHNHRSVTARWFFEMRKALRNAWNETDRIQVPLLVIQGDQDRIVDPSVVEPWLDKVPVADKTLIRLPDHFHELHNEPDWQDTLQTIVAWLDARVPRKLAAPLTHQTAL